MKLTPRIQKAVNISAKLHDGQKRKGDNLPYILHPYSVAIILSNHTEDEDIIIAGLLHDVLEDVENYSPEDMKRDFGEKVLNTVLQVTEEKDPSDDIEKSISTWEYRKNKYIDDLNGHRQEALMVCCADKIHNLTSMIEAYKKRNQGDGFFDIFNAPGPKKETILFFYERVFSVLKANLKSGIVNELEQIISKAKSEFDLT